MTSDDKIFIENEYLKIDVVKRGAELQRIYSKLHKIDLLWNGDPAYWAKFSPVLFPFVGALKDNEYHYKDTTYPMGRHGFARESEFDVVFQSNQRVEYQLSFSSETLKIYPFKFKLIIVYELMDDTIICTYKVQNQSAAEPLYFSIGAHPAFAIPWRKTHSYDDYYIQFEEGDEILDRYPLTADGLLLTKPISISLKNGKLPLTMKLFYDDALVFKKVKSNSITLGNTKDDLQISMDISDFPFLGIWSAKNAPFVCMEPWLGFADSVSHNKQLNSKEGIIFVNPNSEIVKTWKMKVHSPK